MLKLLPCNNVEFALRQIARNSEEIRKINNQLNNPVAQAKLTELINTMCDSMDHVVKWAEHIRDNQGERP